MKVGDLVRIKPGVRDTYGRLSEEIGFIVRYPKNLGNGPYILWSHRSYPVLFGRVDFLEVVNANW